MVRKLKIVVSILIFLVLFLFGFDKISNLVRYKPHKNDTMSEFYNEEKDSIDVLILGSSEAYSSFSPMQIWDESGVTSYNLSSASQSIPNSYYLLKEGIRTQHPKMVVLEIYTMYYEMDYHSIPRLHQGMDCIPLNGNKFEMMRDYLSRTLSWRDQLEFVFPIIAYHTRAYDLESKDFNVKKRYLRGYLPRNGVEVCEIPELVRETKEIPELNMEYMEKIVETCETEGIELILCKTPVGNYKAHHNNAAIYNSVEEYAKEKDIAYIDFNKHIEEIDINYATDFYDKVHVNTLGAQKVTTYLTEYMKNNYNVIDHRNDSQYESWNEDSEKYQIEIQKAKNKVMNNLEN